jgi:hypothetical protein
LKIIETINDSDLETIKDVVMDIKRFDFTSAVFALDQNHMAVPFNLVALEPYLFYSILPRPKYLDDIVWINEN